MAIELTDSEKEYVKAAAAADVKAKAVVDLQTTRDAETEAAKETYSIATKAANDKFTAAVDLLEG